MTKMLNATTRETEDAALAVEEILEQLDLENNALERSAGFVTCSYDFLETGVAAAICEALPFDVAGCTTLTNATNDEADTMMFVLSVLTSDECEFAAVITKPLEAGTDAPVEGAWQQALGALSAPPALIIAFPPMLLSVGGEEIMNTVMRTVGDTPVFGTIACDHDTSTYQHSYTFLNGTQTTDCLAMLVIAGPIDPAFFVLTTSKDKIKKQSAIITESEGSVVRQIDNMSARDYMESIGLAKGGGIEGMSSIPFMVNYNDGTPPVARAIYMLSDDGSVVCGAAMPRGATLKVGVMDHDDILDTAQDALTQALATGKTNGLILFPCLGRSMVLGADMYAEINRVQKTVADRVPFHLAYSGGEVCPVYNAAGKPINRFHNFTFIACIF